MNQNLISILHDFQLYWLPILEHSLILSIEEAFLIHERIDVVISDLALESNLNSDSESSESEHQIINHFTEIEI
jgi:hypothetical protein